MYLFGPSNGDSINGCWVYCTMYLFGPTNGGSTKGYWVCYVPGWPNQWGLDQWLLGVPTCLAQSMVVRPMVVGCAMYLFDPTNGGFDQCSGYWVCYVPIWPNQVWFDQWLLGMLCTCLAQPMVVRPMVIWVWYVPIWPTKGGSINGCWVRYVPIWPTNGGSTNGCWVC